MSAVTQRARAELVPSRPVFCLHPAPTATSLVPEAPHPGWRPLTGALTSVWLQAPHSPSWVRRAVVGVPLGCPLWSSLGGPRCTPAGTPESRAEPDTLRTPACQRPGPRLQGPLGPPGALGPSVHLLASVAWYTLLPATVACSVVISLIHPNLTS